MSDGNTGQERTPIRVALVDDQQLVRGGFRMLIQSQPDLEVVAEAADGREALEILSRVTADVVLMDVRMPEVNGIETTWQLLERGEAAPKIIVLTTFDLDEYVLDAIRAGASGFLLKDTAPEELLTAIRRVHRGDAVISPAMTRRLLRHVQPMLAAPRQDAPVGGERQGRAALQEQLASLTQREIEVLNHIAQGLSNQEIAEALVISEPTVKTHVAHLLQKTASRDRVQAVVFAYESGLVVP
ncbi:MAG: response regulator [Microbacteriaceae bacterium]